MAVKMKIKKKKYDQTDFSKTVVKSDLETFAMKMHERLVSATKIVEGDTDNIDTHILKSVLSDYPSIYSWAIIENILIQNIHAREQEKFDNKMKIWFDEYSNLEGNEKATQKKLDAAIYVENKDEIDKDKTELRELRYKCDVSAGMVKVWVNTINALQSISKQVVSEMELSKLGFKKQRRDE